MPRFSNMKQMQENSTVAQAQPTATLIKPRKTPGTRLGILQDWREASNKSGKTSAGIGKALRDGR